MFELVEACWKSTELSGAVLMAAALLRASGLSTERACGEAIQLARCLQQDTWQVGKGVLDEQPF